MSGRAHVWVRGDVQGVGFRAFVRRAAVGLGLRGWVRNLRDGRVEVVAEGENSDLDVLIGELRRGPLMSQVEDLEIVREEPEGEPEGFGFRPTA